MEAYESKVEWFDVKLESKPKKATQKQLWIDNITGSQVHALMKPGSRWNLLIEKHFKVVKKSVTSALMKHGNHCEEHIALPFLVKRFGACSKNLHLRLDKLRISGNMDYYNVEKNFICEVKTTTFDPLKSLLEQNNPTVEKAIYQLLLYRLLVFHMTKSFPLLYLIIVANNNKCVANNCNINDHPVYVIDFDTTICNQFKYNFNNISLLKLIQDFWTDCDDFEGHHTKADESLSKMNLYYLNDAKIKVNEKKIRDINNNALEPFREQLKVLGDEIETIRKNNLYIKSSFALGDTFYDPQTKLSIHKYMTPTSGTRTMFTVKKWKIK